MPSTSRATVAAAPGRCSRLSRTSRTARWESTVSRAADGSTALSPICAAIVVATWEASCRPASSTATTSPPRRATTSCARRVFPEPPGPVRVTSRCDSSRARTSATSRSRPTKESCGGRRADRTAGARGQVGVLTQDPLVHRAQPRAGIRTQLVGQGPTGRLVELERRLVATLPRDGPHRELGEALAPRFGGSRPLQRDDERVEVRRLRRPQDGRRPALEHVQTAVHQVAGRSDVERHPGEVGERLPPPQPERPAQDLGGRTVLAGDTQPAPLLGELGEQHQVARGGGQVQPVAGTHGLEQTRVDRAARSGSSALRHADT